MSDIQYDENGHPILDENGQPILTSPEQQDAEEAQAEADRDHLAEAHTPGEFPRPGEVPPIPDQNRDPYPIVSEAKQRAYERFQATRGVESPSRLERMAVETPVQGEVYDERIAHFTESRTLPKGSIVHINGLPFQLGDDTMVYGEGSNLDVALGEGASRGQVHN